MVHPNPLGHKMLADLFIYALSLPSQRYSTGYLPVALVRGNAGTGPQNTCRFGRSLKRVVSADAHWSFDDKDPTKAGFLSNSSEALLDMHLTNVISGAVTLFYVRSWRDGTGSCQLSCLDGCSCSEQQIDAHHGQDTHTEHASFSVSVQSKACTIRIHAYDAFKLTGIVTGQFNAISLLDFMSTEKRMFVKTA